MIKQEEKERRKRQICGLTMTPSFPHLPALLGEWGRTRSQEWRSSLEQWRMEDGIVLIFSLLLNIQLYFKFFTNWVCCAHDCNLVNHLPVLSQSGSFSTLFYPLILLMKKREKGCLGTWQTVKVKPGNYRKTLKMSEPESKPEFF